MPNGQRSPTAWPSTTPTGASTRPSSTGAWTRRCDATTQADLSGLFHDLPGTEPAQAPLPEWPAPTDPRPPRRARGHGHPRAWRRVPFLIFVILITAIVGRELTRPFIGWLWLGLLALAVLHYGPRLRRRR